MANKPEKEKKHFFRNFKAELKKVIWPTPKQVLNNTIAVATIVIVTAIIVLILDLTFEGLNTFGINKLKTIVNTNTINEVVDEPSLEDEGTEQELEVETESNDEDLPLSNETIENDEE